MELSSVIFIPVIVVSSFLLSSFLSLNLSVRLFREAHWEYLLYRHVL